MKKQNFKNFSFKKLVDLKNDLVLHEMFMRFKQ